MQDNWLKVTSKRGDLLKAQIEEVLLVVMAHFRRTIRQVDNNQMGSGRANDFQVCENKTHFTLLKLRVYTLPARATPLRRLLLLLIEKKT